MLRLTLFFALVAIAGNLVTQSRAVQAQADRIDLRLMVVGLAAKNYQESMEFYTNVELNELIPESLTKKAMDAWK